MTEILPNGFFVVDHNWIVTHWNKTAEDLLGVKQEFIVGRNLWEALAGVIPLKFFMAFHKAVVLDIPVHSVEQWGKMGAWFDVVTYFFEDSLSVSLKSRNKHRDYGNII